MKEITGSFWQVLEVKSKNFRNLETKEIRKDFIKEVKFGLEESLSQLRDGKEIPDRGII